LYIVGTSKRTLQPYRSRNAGVSSAAKRIQALDLAGPLAVYCVPEVPVPLQAEPKPAGQKAITCTDDQGQVWFLTEDSQVGDWLRFKEAGGTVLAYEPEGE
jgi:hypothetical protein